MLFVPSVQSDTAFNVHLNFVVASMRIGNDTCCDVFSVMCGYLRAVCVRTAGCVRESCLCRQVRLLVQVRCADDPLQISCVVSVSTEFRSPIDVSGSDQLPQDGSA